MKVTNNIVTFKKNYTVFTTKFCLVSRLEQYLDNSMKKFLFRGNSRKNRMLHKQINAVT